MNGTSKRTVCYFISYTREDGGIPDQFLAELHSQLGASNRYEFVQWRDTEILPGEKWHEEIQRALDQCDFGLLLVSPAFLGNSYIAKHELPGFVVGAKPCIPVHLRRIDLKTQDLRGLEGRSATQPGCQVRLTRARRARHPAFSAAQRPIVALHFN